MGNKDLEKRQDDLSLIFKNRAESLRLSNGILLSETISYNAQLKAKNDLQTALVNIELTPAIVIEKETFQVNEELLDKRTILERYLKQSTPIEEVQYLQDYIIRKEFYLRFLEKINSSLNFKQIIDDLVSEEKAISKDDISATLSISTLRSLQSTFQKAVERQKLATDFIDSITAPLIKRNRQLLTSEVDSTGTPIVNTRVITEEVAKQIPLSSIPELLELVTDLDLEKINNAISLMDQGTEDFSGLFCFCYAIKNNDSNLKIKTDAISVLSRVIQNRFGLNIQLLYSNQINNYSASLIKQEEILSSLESKRQKETINQISSLVKQVQFSSDSKDIESVLRVALAYWELEQNSNDEFLNPKAVMKSLVDAVFFNKPLTIKFVRSLRWCYPNGDVEIPPTAGDWSTFDSAGKPIVRKEQVEIDKLNIFKERVLKPLVNWRIPTTEVILLSTGDYEMTGPGYEFSDDDIRCRNAQKYVDDVRQRLSNWQVFDNLPFPYIVQTVKDYIKSRQTEFDQVANIIRQGLDDAYRKSGDYCGYTYQSLEFILEREDNNRAPFIKWWTRKKSFDFTLYKTWFEMTIGWLISKYDENTLLIVSGNRASGLPLSKGRQIDSGVKEVGIMSVRLVNDGEVSRDFKNKTDVV